MVGWLLCFGSGGRNSPQLCVQEKMLLVSSCQNLYNCATLLMSDGTDRMVRVGRDLKHHLARDPLP